MKLKVKKIKWTKNNNQWTKKKKPHVGQPWLA